VNAPPNDLLRVYMMLTARSAKAALTNNTDEVARINDTIDHLWPLLPSQDQDLVNEYYRWASATAIMERKRNE
jgi:hypothetical protein